MSLDFRLALNTISDVVQNRPIPLREFDQIYMKVGDMVIQTEFIARRFNNLDVVFIGDGDAISLSVMHLKNKHVFEYGPKSIHVLDFDERIVNSINKFSKDNDLTSVMAAELYNVADPLPEYILCQKDAFYTNPPWGASNEGESVNAFAQRGIETLKHGGLGAIIIADDDTLEWTQSVLLNTQKAMINKGFIVAEMIPGLHNYHLDDAPELKSCTLIIKNLENSKRTTPPSGKLSADKLKNFYGRNNPLKIKYVRDLSGLNYGKAPDGSYKLEPLEV